MSLTAGQTLSFYEILEPIGAGGMGEVWRAPASLNHAHVVVENRTAEFTER